MNFISVMLLTWSAVYSLTAVASDVPDLNSARVSVADRSDTEFKRATAKALEAVIIKLTGSSAAAQTKSARAVIGQAQRLVQQFSYERPRDASSNADALDLRVEFDSRVLHEEMRARQLVVWGKERPDTLIWLVTEDENGRRLLGAQDTHQAVGVLKRRAAERGIPLVFPRADASEAAAVVQASSAAEIESAVREYSETYNVRSVLVGYLRQAPPNMWENDWLLNSQGETSSWEQLGDVVELLAEEAADSLADALGRRYAGSTQQSAAELVAVLIRGVTSARDYARTERYLSSVDSVRSLVVRQVDTRGITFDLTVNGGLRALTQTISFGQLLAPDTSDPSVFDLKP
ncbi:MAG: DUF2066 domain-containing protein [Proteobacteria bacterium]|nr:DUF2066 domain-containing protein [Pseudomonadota bacterium]